ncbi:MAG TPA: nucleotidyltransferase family protein [Candidatus Omnitrophota bacterium]|nr:nucleotidyltransferase family protein [Candidatus Omnitrophota bacterium]HPT06671.1 nucleotidyltransferase family protein [Candidatus Omnitrophota bacterium]
MTAHKYLKTAQTFVSFLGGATIDEPDWQALADYAIEKKLSPPFFLRLREYKSGSIPPEVIATCKVFNLINIQHNLELEKELNRVLSCLKEKNIQVMVLKGLFFARYMYNDIALRQVPVDLDLLIKPDQFAQARSILEDAGYYCEESVIGQKKSALKLKYTGQIGFSSKKDGGRYFIELHIDLRGLFVYPQELDLWRAAKELNFDGMTLLAPEPENLLIYLCLLTMPVSELTELKYIYDLHVFLLKFGPDINWEKIHETVARRHAACVYYALMLSKELFGSAVPPDFLKAIQPGLLKRAVVSFWLRKNNIITVSRMQKSRWYFQFSSWHYFASSCLYSLGIMDCFGIIWKKLFPSPEEISLMYNETSASTCWLYVKRICKPFLHICR